MAEIKTLNKESDNNKKRERKTFANIWGQFLEEENLTRLKETINIKRMIQASKFYPSTEKRDLEESKEKESYKQD